MTLRKFTFGLACAFGAAGLLAIRETPPVQAQETPLPNTGLADASTFLHLYGRWRAAFESSPESQALHLALQPFDGASAEPVNATGEVRVETGTGSVRSSIQGLPAGEWDLWLIDNRGTGSSFPDSGDAALNVGRYRADGPFHTLQESVPADRLAGFEVDRAAVVRAGAQPSAFVLLGSANIYERLHRGFVRSVGGGTARTESDIWQLAARGRALFRSERFQGNGRSCGTCHAEANNFTLDAEFIAALPASDPLFVHERDENLRANFENAELLRRLGLIVANADGLDDLPRKFTLRPPVSIQAIGTQSLAPEPVFAVDLTIGGSTPNPAERLGWSNDALPLREFAIGATAQHMPRTVSRKAGTDFRVPTDDELDALAVYQLSVGRSEDFDLSKLKLHSSQARRGQALYRDTGEIGAPGHKNCNACHFNGGGTAAFGNNPDAPGFSPVLDANPRGFNGTFGTNVNELPASIQLAIPRDGGFGRSPLPNRGFGNLFEFPGAGVLPFEEFNSMSVVESADTAPYFHNHSVATLEESIAYYGTAAYAGPGSIGETGIGPVPVTISADPSDPEVRAIATFLRVLNTLENVRSAVSATERARRAPDAAAARELAALAREEVQDAIRVFATGSLQANTEFVNALCRGRLSAANSALAAAASASEGQSIEPLLTEALFRLRGARALLADESTLPASFQR